MLAVLILIALLAYWAACTAVGFVTPAVNRDTYEPDVGPIGKLFSNDVQEVVGAYKIAVASTPGMAVLSEWHNGMLIDGRPSSRILSGSFGVVLRLDVAPDPGGTRVSVSGRKKVPFAVFVKDGATLVHSERKLRMNAKKLGLSEVVG